MTRESHTTTDSSTTNEYVDPDAEASLGKSLTEAVTFPDGTTEEVEPHYDIFVAVDPREFYPDIENTAITRLELSGVGSPADAEVHDALLDGFQEFVAGGGSVDGLIEKVYTRSVGDETALCVVVRSPHDEGSERSELALALDGVLRERFTDD